MWTRRTALRALPGIAGIARLRAAGPITIPARLNDFQQIYVPVRINGSAPLWFELDTGGGGALFFIDTVRAAAIGVRATTLGRSAGPIDNQMGTDGRTVVTAAFPGLTLRDQQLVIQPRPMEKEGIIGLSVFSRYVAELDYEAPALRLHDPGSAGGGPALPFALEGNNPVVTAILTLPGGDEVRGRFVVDTGAGGSILYLARSFVDRNHLIGRGLRWVPDSVGLQAARIERFSLGAWKIEKPVIRQFPARGFGGGPEPDGLIGAEFLRRFRVLVDYAGTRIALTPNSRYEEPSRFDASGLRVHRSPAVRDGFPIFLVVPETPAAEAGLRESDILLALDGIPADRMSPGVAAEALSHDGRECVLLIQRENEVFTVKLKLRNLL